MDCLKFSKESDKSKSSKKKLIGLGPKSKLKHSRSRETTNAAPKMESKPAEKSPEAACAMIPNGFTDVDREEMKQAFDLFDKNHDGKISSEELGCVLRTLGWEYTQVEVEEMIKNADTNENGFVEYDEFLVMMKKWSGQASLPSVDEKTREAFRVFDMDGNGYIDKHELRYVMRRLGENLSEDDIRDMFKEADLNEDGKIDFNEFRQLLGTCKLK